MTEHDNLDGEPDLDAPGKPLIQPIRHPDGTITDEEVPRTKRENVAETILFAGEPGKVTTEMLAVFGVSVAEFEAHMMDMAKYAKKLVGDRRFLEEICGVTFPDEPVDQ
jgi:hypothetical protein